MPQLAIIVNPTKFDDLEAVKETVARECAEQGWPPARWIETTKDDPGTGQASRAASEGADLVCPLGGDGTVRAVAEGVVGTGVPLGLLPGGTGNLLARNLKLPVDDLAAALRVALTGVDSRIDVGWIQFDDDPEHLFLVMAGMGLDADTMDTDEVLKKRIGVFAYIVAGVKAALRPGFRAILTDEKATLRRQRARMVAIGNCGELAGGIELLPDAAVDDGVLDAIVLSPDGVVGWLAIVLDVLTGHRRGHPRLRHRRSPRFEVRTGRLVPSQIDGDIVGPRRRMVVRVDPGVLIVRTPAAESR